MREACQWYSLPVIASPVLLASRTGVAIQLLDRARSPELVEGLDCFVASVPRNDKLYHYPEFSRLPLHRGRTLL